MKINNISRQFIAVLISAFLLFSCQNEHNNNQIVDSRESQNNISKEAKNELFNLLSPEKSGIDFVNTITETELHNVYTDIYIYNGGGVGLGDINNDNLLDIFFTSNQGTNKLYLNKGNLKFEDISESSGIQSNGWHTGVSFVDINQDGWMDIYVCRAGSLEKNENLRRNLLYINQKDNTFKNMAEEYGIDYPGYNVDAVFFDMDLDNDLDLIITGYATEKISYKADDRKLFNKQAPESFRNVLFKNNGKKFENVTQQYGIDEVGYGLGLAVADLNNDAYPDIYIGNDFAIDDAYYQNNAGKGFTNKIKSSFRHTSNFSMGMDIGDLNNDGLNDVVVADMNPGNNFRQKSNMPSMNPELFWSRINEGLHPQFMRNVVQLNQGNNLFSEIGQLSGVDKTDWTWSVLIKDLDNDGWNDLIFSNGMLKNSQSKDVVNFIKERQAAGHPHPSWNELKDLLPGEKVTNKVYQNNKDLTFTNQTENWNFNNKSISNGMAVGDLDNDGDIDIVTNNINENSTLWENKLDNKHNYIRFKIKGNKPNINGIGTKIKIKYQDQINYSEYNPYRGFQSSSEPYIHFGIGDAKIVDSVWIEWADTKYTLLTKVDVNNTYTLEEHRAPKLIKVRQKKKDELFLRADKYTNINFRHKENPYDDYKDQVLLPHQMSKFGPNISVGDINGDQFPEFYIGGAAGQSGELFAQISPLKFKPYPIKPWEVDKASEDMGSVFFDANGDGVNDLYIVSGGYEFDENAVELQDRLYINEGQGNYVKDTKALPDMRSSGSCVCAADYDKDGDMDLFVGGRLQTKNYPHAGTSYLLENTNGQFKDVTQAYSSTLKNIGMVNTCIWSDINNDGNMELILTGDWMNIEVFSIENNKLINKTTAFGLDKTNGWWNKITAADFDKDGDMDYVVGNLGLNYKYKASHSDPFSLYYDDISGDGSTELIFGYRENGIEFPLRGLQCSSEQLPELKRKFKKYNDFAAADIETVYGNKLKKANKNEAYIFESVYLENSNGQLLIKKLPNQAQISPSFGIIAEDFNQDNNIDILLAGNLFVSEVETGMADAGIGCLLLGDGKGNFEYEFNRDHGFLAINDVRDLAVIKNPTSDKNIVLIGNNNAPLQSFLFKVKNR